MKNVLIVTIVLLAASCSLWAVDDGQVEYLGGTVPGLEVSAVGKLDLTSEIVMQFNSTKGTFTIPYMNIDSFEYTQELTHHLGVLPSIAVGLTRTRKHRHYFRIVYHNDSNVSQIVVIEVPKHMPSILETVLKARAPHATPILPDGKRNIAGGRPNNCDCRAPGL
ncbi:MAG TPA: hypothetical protein VLK33_19520 [Terriglobales bacterium]|nr:hypothetical protein [Terriglobales bacterium]